MDNNLAVIPQFVEEYADDLQTETRYQQLYDIIQTSLVTENWTGPGVYAQIQFKMLEAAETIEKRASLQYLVVKGRIISEIKLKELYRNLGFDTPQSAVAALCGISTTQYSMIMRFYETILPGLCERGINIMTFWDKVNRSNMGEITPHMMELLTGEESKSENVHKEVEKLLKKSNGDEDKAIEKLIDMAEGTNSTLRTGLSHEKTPPIDVYVIERDDQKYIIARVTNDQREMMMRAMKSNAEWSQTISIGPGGVKATEVALLRELNE